MGLLLASPLAREGGRSLDEGHIKMENKVHQKTVFVQFGFIDFRPFCHPEFISGSNQNVVNTPKWQDAETSSA